MDVPSQKKADNVGEAKQRLRLLSAQFEPLGFIKKRPLRTTGIALLAGLAWGVSRRSGKAAVNLMPLAIQLAGLATRWSLAVRQQMNRGESIKNG